MPMLPGASDGMAVGAADLALGEFVLEFLRVDPELGSLGHLELLYTANVVELQCVGVFVVAAVDASTEQLECTQVNHLLDGPSSACGCILGTRSFWVASAETPADFGAGKYH